MTTDEPGGDLPATVGAVLAAQVAARPDATLLVCDDERLTYADADRRSAALARGLLAAGVGRGSHVGLLLASGPAFVVGWLAAARLGAVTIPISTFSRPAELLDVVARARVGLLVAAPATRSNDHAAALATVLGGFDPTAPGPLWSPTAPALRRLAMTDLPAGWHPDASLDALLAAGDHVDPAVLAAAEAAVTPADRMVVVHTSGSSAAPKGVIHPHGTLIRHLRTLNAMRRYAPGEVLFSNSPFFWIGGFAYTLLGTLVAGATLVCSNAAAASQVLDVLERERPTMGNGFAQAVAHLADDPSFARRDLSSLRRGNLYPIMPPDARPADPGLRHAMLGMTEAGSVCLLSDDEGDQPEHRRGSFGRPAPGLEARVVDPDTGLDVDAGGSGELWLRGDPMMEGYLGVERHDTFTPDRWYRTGDAVHVDAEGFHHFTGRLGDLVKTAGANVSPAEVAAAITEVSGLTAHVVGVDDEARGQIVVAVVVAPDPAAFDPDTVRAALRDRLSAYKVPRRFVVVAPHEVPMLSSGKVDRRALQEMARG